MKDGESERRERFFLEGGGVENKTLSSTSLLERRETSMGDIRTSVTDT